jgi:hypothetical protein
MVCSNIKRKRQPTELCRGNRQSMKMKHPIREGGRSDSFTEESAGGWRSPVSGTGLRADDGESGTVLAP